LGGQELLAASAVSRSDAAPHDCYRENLAVAVNVSFLADCRRWPRDTVTLPAFSAGVNDDAKPRINTASDGNNEALGNNALREST
jgi:hypothetical protein